MYDDFGHDGCGEPMAIWLSKPSPDAVRHARKKNGAIHDVDDQMAREVVETGQAQRGFGWTICLVQLEISEP
jgi:hypothetical protein